MLTPEKQLPAKAFLPVTENRTTINEIFSLVYEDLHRSAASLRRGEMRETMTTTALVHEAWFKLKNSPSLAGLSRAHFKSIAIRAMRQVLVEEARRRLALKRDCNLVPFTEEAAAKPFFSSIVDFLAMDDAINELALLSERQANVVCMRVFGGGTVDEIAEALDVSRSSVERDWRIAKAWLAVRIRTQHEAR